VYLGPKALPNGEFLPPLDNARITLSPVGPDMYYCLDLPVMDFVSSYNPNPHYIMQYYYGVMDFTSASSIPVA